MDLAQLLLTPRNAAHRQYEALRAYLVERVPSPEVARRYGYTYGALQQLVHQFRRQPNRQFFVDSPRPGAKADDVIRQRVIHLRKQNQSVYDISEALKNEGIPRSRASHCFNIPRVAKSWLTCEAFRRSASAMLVTPTVRRKPMVALRKPAITCGPDRLRIRLESSPIVTSRT